MLHMRSTDLIHEYSVSASAFLGKIFLTTSYKEETNHDTMGGKRNLLRFKF